jgi:predicted nucleic acid-binding protein
LLDIDVLVHLRDGDRWTRQAVNALDPPLFISAITHIELENGAWREPDLAEAHRVRLRTLLSDMVTLEFGMAQIAEYGGILASARYSRRKVADRMTAATALAADLPLVTFNGGLPRCARPRTYRVGAASGISPRLARRRIPR